MVVVDAAAAAGGGVCVGVVVMWGGVEWGWGWFAERRGEERRGEGGDAAVFTYYPSCSSFRAESWKTLMTSSSRFDGA